MRYTSTLPAEVKRAAMHGLRPLAIAVLALVAALPAAAQEPTDGWEAIGARNIGPAGMSGRVSAVEVVLSDPDVIYVGGATGGLFRSRDGGVTWTPVFDEADVLGVGDVAVFQANPAIVWVGTGEGNPRNSAGVGRGIWKSVDGGDTWERMGLEDSERIHRVVTHPSDPDVVYVAAMGPAWSDGEERGVYRTTDGGATWERVLYANARTGAADLVMDPTNPDKLFAAMWEFRRWPWFFDSGGEGSALFVTYDGGEVWREITAADGLPAGELGRIGVAISRSDPRVVYALVEAERSELVRSDDGGRTWRTINDDAGIVSRPFYYADLRVDPLNENRIYSLNSAIEVSEDQGHSWRTVVPSRIIHGDVHELWIDPADPEHMIIGNDGGVGITHDRGRSWRFVENLPLAQFYRISVDQARPFNVYGGLQDNGSWWGPSDVWESKGILNAHWRRVGGGDGFQVHVDPSDPRYGYAASQGGSLNRFDKVTGASRSVQPVRPQGVEPLRFNWNAAFAVDPHDARTIYIGSQFVHRSRDHGASWEIISPDLTTDDPAKQRQDSSGGLTMDATGAENHTTIIDVVPSPLLPGLIWVGTDDGNVQATSDGGATWTEVGGNVPGVPEGTWVADVEASHHDADVAYAVYDDHRRGNWETYVYRTDDRGESWERLPTVGITTFAHDLAEDPEEPGLVFLGTEGGLYVSLDHGGTWTHWTANGLPPAPVRALVVHPRDGDLVVGTHGRAAWIVDDIRPLRELAADAGVRDRAVHAFAPPPAYLHETAEGIGYRSTGHAMFQGETRPYGALLSYWAGGEAGSATVEIRDGVGSLVRSLEDDAEPGINRVVWNLEAGEETEAGNLVAGVEVLPGAYQVTVRLGAATSTAPLDVRADPDAAVTMADRRARLGALARAAALVERADAARERLSAALDATETVLETLLADAGGLADADDLAERVRALRDTLGAAQRRLFTGPACQGICGGTTVAGTVRGGLSQLRGSWTAPGENDRIAVARAEAALGVLEAEMERLERDAIEPVRRALTQAGYTPLPSAGAPPR